MLGRNAVLDSLAEATAIDEDTLRKFFKEFVSRYAKDVAPHVVRIPTTEEELRECEYEYKKAGFPGFIGSVGFYLGHRCAI